MEKQPGSLTSATDTPRTFDETVTGVMDRLREKAAQTKASPKVEPTEQERTAHGCTARLAATLGRRYSAEACRLDTFRLHGDKAVAAVQNVALAQLRAIQADLDPFLADGGGLMFYGGVGSGKDHLLAAMLYAAAARGVECRWVSGQELLGAFYDRMDTKRPDEDYFRELVAPQVLGVSDPLPPSGHAGDWDLRTFYRLVDRRYRVRKSTWLTINVATAEEADRCLSQPVFDRLVHDSVLIACLWPSFRGKRSVL